MEDRPKKENGKCNGNWVAGLGPWKRCREQRLGNYCRQSGFVRGHLSSVFLVVEPSKIIFLK